jgi:hypothetical protein
MDEPDDINWMARSQSECVSEIARLQRCYDAVLNRAESAERDNWMAVARLIKMFGETTPIMTALSTINDKLDELKKLVRPSGDKHDYTPHFWDTIAPQWEETLNEIHRVVGSVGNENLVDSVKALKAQVDEQEELRRKAVAGLMQELKRKPTKRERLVQAVQWLVYDSAIARLFEVFQR